MRSPFGPNTRTLLRRSTSAAMTTTTTPNQPRRLAFPQPPHQRASYSHFPSSSSPSSPSLPSSPPPPSTAAPPPTSPSPPTPTPPPATFQSRAEIESFLGAPTWSARSLLDPTRAAVSKSASSSPTTSSSTASSSGTRPTTTATATPEITPDQLSHLLRLSALPTPSSSGQTQSLLDSLSSQLQFVTHIREADLSTAPPPHSPQLAHSPPHTPLSNNTPNDHARPSPSLSHLPPLRAIRDESPAGIAESVITPDHHSIRSRLEAEDVVGTRHVRVRRRWTDPVSDQTAAAEGWDVLKNAGASMNGYFVVRRQGGGGEE